jgi:hypothetical protein
MNRSVSIEAKTVRDCLILTVSCEGRGASSSMIVRDALIRFFEMRFSTGEILPVSYPKVMLKGEVPTYLTAALTHELNRSLKYRVLAVFDPLQNGYVVVGTDQDNVYLLGKVIAPGSKIS